MTVAAHRVQVVGLGDEACVGEAARDLLDGDVVRAELGRRVALVPDVLDAETELAFVVTSPREDLCVVVVFCLNV